MSSRYEQYQEKIDDEILVGDLRKLRRYTGQLSLTRPGGSGSSITATFNTWPNYNNDPDFVITQTYSKMPGTSTPTIATNILILDNVMAILWDQNVTNVEVSGRGCTSYENRSMVVSGPTRYYTKIYVGDSTAPISVVINQ